jgi:hypothetical protein
LLGLSVDPEGVNLKHQLTFTSAVVNLPFTDSLSDFQARLCAVKLVDQRCGGVLSLGIRKLCDTASP